ncbi:MAG: CsgG/HfaB family protein [Candidatus Firestonebacteria bacterium]
MNRFMFVFLLLSTSLFASEKISMAVYDFDARTVNTAIADSVADYIQNSLFETGRFNMMDRKNVQKILKEQMFQKTGCSSTDCAVEAGRILNVSNMVLGSVSKVGSRFVISIQLVDVELSKIVVTDKVETDSEDMLSAASTALANHFSKQVSIKGKVLKVMSENEIIVNLGSQDKIENDQELAIERLGESIKDDAGKVIYQTRTQVGKAKPKEILDEACRCEVVSKTTDVKTGDIVEIKKEAQKPLEPMLKNLYSQAPALQYSRSLIAEKTAAVALPPENTGMEFNLFVNYELSGLFSFKRYDTKGNLTVAETKLGSFDNHLAYGVSFGSGDEWTSFGNIISLIVSPGFKDLSGLVDNNRFFMMMQDGIYFKLYPFSGSNSKKKMTLAEKRGDFAPYLGLTGNLYLGMFNPDVNSSSTIYDMGTAFLLGFGLEAKIGFDIGNIFFIEAASRFVSSASGESTLKDAKTYANMGKNTYSFNLNTLFLSAGFKF